MEIVTATPNDTEGEKTVGLEWNIDNFPENANGDASYSITATLKDGYHFDDVDKTNEISVEVLVVNPDNAKLLEALEQHVTTDKVVDPIGTKINLFDYWSGETRFEKDLLPLNKSDVVEENKIYLDKGINENKYLKFAANFEGTKGKNINRYTGGGNQELRPFSGIVENLLDSKGYPILKAGNVYEFKDDTLSENGRKTERQSLDYLFDPEYSEDEKFRKSFEDVKGLLKIDTDGYYYYNAKKDATDFDSANYAYFDEASNSFVLYDTWGAERNTSGQFFPFTGPEKVFKLNETTGDIEQIGYDPNDSNDPNKDVVANFANHYFGLTMSTRFVQKNGGKTVKEKDITYEFSGDDDVWIFIDDVLVGDLGGNHDPVSITINFSTGEVDIKNKNGDSFADLKTTIRQQFEKAFKEEGKTLNPADWSGETFADDTYHTLKFFYLERGNYDSNLSLRFNLEAIPESMLEKLDQIGRPIEGAEFELYAAKSLPENGPHESSEVLIATPIDVATTNKNGEFVFWNEDFNSPYSFEELYKEYKTEYFILRETKVPDGYRPFKDANPKNEYNDICLHFDPQTKVIESKHYWETGVFAEPNVTAKAPLEIKPHPSIVNPKFEILKPYDKLDTGDNISIFAVALMRVEENGGTDKWLPVTGDPVNGWTIHKSVVDVIKQYEKDDSNIALFEVESAGIYQGTLKHMPGDITDYYWYQKNVASEEEDVKNAKFTVAYYFTDNLDFQNIDEDDIVLLDPDSFKRDFSVTLHVPDIRNYFVVEKVDKNGDPINDIPFSLYKKDEDDGTFKFYKEGVTKITSYGNITSKGGMLIFDGLEMGEYYLVEKDNENDLYKPNPNPVKIIVDKNGVYADAGASDDGISTRLEIGSVLKSVRQFASDDGVDNTLHDIQVKQLTSIDSENWNTWDDAGEPYHFYYVGISEDNPKEYKPFNEGPELPEVNEGWSKLSVRQCYIHDNGEGNIKNAHKKNLEELGIYDITGLFSPTLFVKVVNEFEEDGNLTVKKVVTGSEGNKTEPFTFEVVLNDNRINGEYGNMSFKDGKATFQLKHGESKTAIGLPVGIGYTVTEVEANGYTTTSVNSTGTIPEDGVTVTFTNQKGSIVPPDPDEPVNPPTDPDEPTDPDTDKPTDPTDPEEPVEPENPIEPETEEPSVPEKSEEDDEVPDTSARSNLMVWIGLSIVSFAVIVATLFSRKQNRCK